jgi:putative transposase
MLPFPLQFLLLLFAGWVNRRQVDAIEYLKEENRLLKDRLGERRIRFTDAERCRLARRANALGRKALGELETLVTPDTLLRWYRSLIARKWGFSHRRGPGRLRTQQTIVELIIRMATENPSWGYTQIQGALGNLRHEVGRETIANVLKENGIDPALERGKRTRWSTFLKAHWECLAAADFFSVEVFTLGGLVTHHVLFFIDLASRAVHVAGVTVHPDHAWMMQAARNVTDVGDGVLRDKRYLILDRDTKYTEGFHGALSRQGIEVIRLPVRAPNMNAHAERFVRTIKEECLNRMVFVGARSLRHAIRECVEHYHVERNHQGLENRIPRPVSFLHQSNTRVKRRTRLGGMLQYYHRAAA